MKRLLLATTALSLMTIGSGVAMASTHGNKLSTDQQKLSYTIGYDMGDNFKSQSINVDVQALSQGIEDGIKGQPTEMTKKQMQDTLLQFQKKMMAQKESDYKEASQSNLAASKKFLAENKTKAGVKTMPSGLQYKVLKPGSGASPTKDDVVTVDYKGTFINGDTFDSSYERGKPATFPLTQVIAAWQEALTHMKKGAVWMIYVPPKLGYGDHKVGPIGPNQALVFKIHLISFKPANGDSGDSQ